MEEAMALPGGDEIVTNQVLYNLMHRGIEWDLHRWSRTRGIPIMAYSPVGNNRAEQKQIFGNAAVKTVAARHNATPAQVALAWLLREPEVVSIPKALRPDHLRENRAALDIQLTGEDIKELDQAFPTPDRKVSLEMI
jgi:diketogulonate reductase-like aldo/keto reductase